jgi:hypothetical protein
MLRPYPMLTLRPYPMLTQQCSQFFHGLPRPRPWPPEERTAQQQEVPFPHRAYGAPLTPLGEGRRYCRVGENGDPVRVARRDRFERNL